MSGMRYLEDVVTLRFESEKCTGCRQCVLVCPQGVMRMNGNRAEVADLGACMECGACQRNCAFDAIHVQSGVGCASAIIASWLGRSAPSCGPADACGNDGGAGCC